MRSRSRLGNGVIQTLPGAGFDHKTCADNPQYLDAFC